jgi:hypothetical protein
MRSELVFTASNKVPNRFMLCKLVSAGVPRLHRAGAAMPATINESLSVAGTEPAQPAAPPLSPSVV